MSNKIMMAILSIITIFFLTAQTCSIPSSSTGLALECVGGGDIVCDDTEAYECSLSAYGTGYYVSRASENDAACGGLRSATEFDEKSLARILISLSSDLEDSIEDMYDLQRQVRTAEANGDGRTLFAIRAELSEVRASLAEISAVYDDVAAAVKRERMSSLDPLITDVKTKLQEAEDLLLGVSVQLTNALAELSGDGTSTLVSASCSVSPINVEVGDAVVFDGSGSYSAVSYLWDFKGDGNQYWESTTASITGYYAEIGTYNPTLTVTANDGITTDIATCGQVVVENGIDSDGDGLSDEREKGLKTNATDADSDNDGYNDGDEVALSLNPLHFEDYSTSSKYSCYSTGSDEAEWKNYYDFGVLYGDYKGTGGRYNDTCVMDSSLKVTLNKYYCTLSDDGTDFVIEKEVVDCKDYDMVCMYGECVPSAYTITDIYNASIDSSAGSAFSFSAKEGDISIMSGIDSTGSFVDTHLHRPSSATSLIIYATTESALESSHVVTVTTDNTVNEEINIYLPTGVFLGDDYLAFYVADDGSTYWADSGNNGVKSDLSDLLTSEDAIHSWHLAQAAS